MYINEEAMRYYGITNFNYINYCKLKGLTLKGKETKAKFFLDIKNGKIYKNKETGEIIYGKEVI